MATTVTASSLSVTINESVTLNGVTYGNSVSKQFTSQGEVDQRIMSINAADYAYFRITNLDDTNFVTLQITSGDTYWIKLKAGESFMLMDNEMDAIASSSVFGAFGDVSKVSADADTADVDIEYVVVTAGAAV